MQFIDLSVSIEDGLPCDPKPQIPHIQYTDHKSSADEMAKFFGEAKATDLPDGNGWAVESLSLSTHSGTHLDAPYHYYPTMNGGEPAWTIDEVPLEWCFGDGVKVDFRDKPDGYKITPEDFEKYFAEVGYSLKPGDIVLVNTGAMDRWGKPEYLTAGCGMGHDATMWLIEHGVHVCGTDAWSWDVPLPFTAQEFNRTHDRSILWEGHRVGMERAYCHMEKLCNLEKLPVSGFKVCCFPVKVKAASGGWTRCVAITE